MDLGIIIAKFGQMTGIACGSFYDTHDKLWPNNITENALNYMNTASLSLSLEFVSFSTPLISIVAYTWHSLKLPPGGGGLIPEMI